jgi:two-component system, NarL family, nitrate/nitrite response regulator NarL
MNSMTGQKYSQIEPGQYEGRNATRTIRILLADDHPVMRIGVSNLLQKDSALEIAGEANDADEAIAKALELKPDILLLDLNMVSVEGLEALHTAIFSAYDAKIIVLTSAITPAEVMKVMELGIRGLVPKDALTDQIIPAIRSVAVGHYWVDGRRALQLPEVLRALGREAESSEPTSYGLTPRELEVVRCIVEGSSNRNIARQFQLSEETVKRHLSNIFDKTGVSTRLELALFALKHQLVASKQ